MEESQQFYTVFDENNGQETQYEYEILDSSEAATRIETENFIDIEETNTELYEEEFSELPKNSTSATHFVTTTANSFAESWMTASVIKQLENLLEKWNFGYLLPILCDECIDINTLKVMTPHQLMGIGEKWGLKWGIRIKLEHVLKNWQKSFEASPKSDIAESVKGNSQITIDVESILKSSCQGRAVLTQYEQNSKLNEGSRAVIVDLIINYMIQNDVHMTVVCAKQTAESILNLFKTEYLGYYYTKQRGSKPQGKIYDKYFNTIRRLKNSGILERKKRSSDAQNSSAKKRILQLGPPELNVDDSIEAILLDNCSWAEIESHWAATKNCRLTEVANAKSITAVLEKWKQYKNPMGFKLIDLDFKHLFPDSKSLAVNFEAFALKIMPIFEDRIKDHESKLIFKKMKELPNITENGRFFGIFYLMHCILIPSAKLVQIENGKKKHIRFSIKDSQTTFLIEGSTVAECEVELLRRHEAKKAIHPLILVSGSVLEPKEIIVYFEGEKYRFHSAVGAIDTCFKIFFVFNLEYPLASSSVWTFIQKHLYKMSTNTDYENPQINSLISNLN